MAANWPVSGRWCADTRIKFALTQGNRLVFGCTAPNRGNVLSEKPRNIGWQTSNPKDAKLSKLPNLFLRHQCATIKQRGLKSIDSRSGHPHGANTAEHGPRSGRFGTPWTLGRVSNYTSMILEFEVTRLWW